MDDSDDISTHHEENKSRNNPNSQGHSDERWATSEYSARARRRASKSNLTGNEKYINFSLRDATNDFLKGTDLHGFSQAKNSAGVVKRGCWSVGFVASVCVLVYHIVLLTDAYMSRDVQVSVGVQEANSAIFPVISVCNLSPYKKSATVKYLAMKNITIDTNSPSASSVLLDNNNGEALKPTSLNANDVTTVSASENGYLATASTTDAINFSPNNKLRRKRAACPTGWNAGGVNDCYKVSPGLCTFNNALATCQSMNNNSWPASILSSNETNYVRGLVGTQPTWIGLDCDSPNYWSDGYPTTYKNFKSNCKSNQGATINSNDNGQWDDHPKTELHNVICKIPGTPYQKPTTTPVPRTIISTTEATTTVTTAVPTTQKVTQTILPTTESQTTTLSSSAVVITTPSSSVSTQTADNLSSTVQTTSESVISSAPSSTTLQTTTTPPTEFKTTSSFDSTSTIDSTYADVQITALPTSVMSTDGAISTETSSVVMESTVDMFSTMAESSEIGDTTTFYSLDASTVDTSLLEITERLTIYNDTSTTLLSHTTDKHDTTTAFLSQTTDKQFTTDYLTTLVTNKRSTPQDHITSRPPLASTVPSTPVTSPSFQRVCCSCTCCSTTDTSLCSTCQSNDVTSAGQCAKVLPDPDITSQPEAHYTTSYWYSSTQHSASLSTTPNIPTKTNVIKAADSDMYNNTFFQVLKHSLANASIVERASLGFQASDLILDCQFNGVTCTLSDFTSFYDATLGNCYSFNSHWNTTRQLYTTTLTGRQHGLQLILAVNQDDYVSGDVAGVRVMVTSQGDMPLPDNGGGLTLSPGHTAHLGLQKVVRIHLPEPYGNCVTDDDAATLTTMYTQLYPVNYTQQACMNMCRHWRIVTECDCVEHGYKLPGDDFAACDTDNVIQNECLNKVTSELATNVTSLCNCGLPCRTTQFITTLSLGAWPAVVNQQTVLAELLAAGARVASVESLSDNFLKLEVFYTDLTYTVYQDQPAYELDSYLADVSAVLGLWLGITAINCGEFIELLLDIALYCASKLINLCKLCTK